LVFEASANLKVAVCEKSVRRTTNWTTTQMFQTIKDVTMWM